MIEFIQAIQGLSPIAQVFAMLGLIVGLIFLMLTLLVIVKWIFYGFKENNNGEAKR